MGAIDRLIIVSAKLVGKALKSEPATKAFEGVGKAINSDTGKKVTNTLDKATGKVFSKLFDNELERVKESLEIMLRNMNKRFFNNSIKENDLFRNCNLSQLMEFLSKDNAEYKIKLKFLLLQYIKICDRYWCDWEKEEETEGLLKELENKPIFSENEQLMKFKDDFYKMKKEIKGYHRYSEEYELELKKMLHEEVQRTLFFVDVLLDFKRMEKYER